MQILITCTAKRVVTLPVQKNWVPYLNYTSIRTDCLGVNPIYGIKSPNFHSVLMKYNYTQETIYILGIELEIASK